MKRLLATLLAALVSSVASANVIYNINRTVGSGSVVGTFETNGTALPHDDGSIVSWSLTLTSAAFGSQLISSASGGVLSDSGIAPVLTATPTELTWDFAAAGTTGDFLYFYGATFEYYYVLAGNFEGIGYTLGFAEQAAPDSAQVIGTVGLPDGGSVPEPSALALAAVGLAGLGLSLRKRG